MTNDHTPEFRETEFRNGAFFNQARITILPTRNKVLHKFTFSTGSEGLRQETELTGFRGIFVKYKDILAIVVATGSLMGHAYADEALAKAKGCLACHAVDKKVVGPGFQDVAAKYKGQADASAMLVEKVQKGGKGTWGAIPMPPNKVSNDEAQTLVMWVLSRD